MNHRTRNFNIIIFAYLLVSSLSIYAFSQEQLEDILQKGYISQWLICGPFDFDMPGGIKSALKNNQTPLSTKDFWENYGGIAQILPQTYAEFTIDKKKYRWVPFFANSHLIDLSGIAQNSDECIFFLASYFQVIEDKTIYVNFQTPLGGRAWISRVKVVDIPDKYKLDTAGVDKALVKVKKGLNIILLQIPFISLKSLSDITRLSSSEIQTKLWLEKDPGIGRTGFELSLKILPAFQSGKIFYISELHPTRIFTKTNITPHQVFHLILYNPHFNPISPVNISAYTLPEGNSILSKQISFKPREEKILEVEVPLSSSAHGENRRRIRFNISAPDDKNNVVSAEFTTEVVTLPPDLQSKIFILTGVYGKFLENFPALERKNILLDWCKNQILYSHETPNYGINLSFSYLWLEFLSRYPDFLPMLKNVVSKGKSSAQNGFGVVEDWFVNPETLIRNIQWGTKLKQLLLKDFHNVYSLWDNFGIAPHTPQIFDSFSILGCISNFSELESPPLFRLYSPSGHSIYIRNLPTPPNFSSIAEIRKWSQIIHYPVRDLLSEIDVLLIENYSTPPLPALLTDLSMYVPPYFIHGNADSEFFQEIDEYLYNTRKISTLPTLEGYIFDGERILNTQYDGILTYILSRLESSTIQTEKVSTFASLAGGKFPDHLLSSLWCNIFSSSNSDYLKGKLSPQERLIAVMDLIRLWRSAEKQKLKALNDITQNMNTLAYSPIPHEEPIPIVVFNTNANITSAPVYIVLDSVPNFPNGRLFTDKGEPIPYLVHSSSSNFSTNSCKVLEFACDNVPPIGTKLYLWIPESYTPKETPTNDLFIENKYYIVKFDFSGNITQILDKDSNESINLFGEGLDVLGELSNDLNEFYPIAEVPISIKSFKSGLKQRIEIQYATDYGKIVKEYSLYEGLPYIYCSHNLYLENKLEDRNEKKTILCTRLSSRVTNNFAITGAPLFGVNQNLKKHKLLPVRSFLASGVTKFLNTNSKGSYPFSEFTTIKTNPEIDFSPFRNAMWRMGIPSKEISLDLDRYAIELGDSYNTLYIWAGKLRELEILKNVLNIRLNDKLYEDIKNREEIGTIFLTSCGTGDTLLGFLASDNSKIHTLLNNFANVLAKHSEYLLPDSLTDIDLVDYNKSNIAVFFEGTKFAKLGKRNELYLVHGNYQLKPILSSLISLSLNYRILPFPKDIDCAELLKMANEEPLVGGVATSHGGQWLPNRSFFSLSSEKLSLLSIKPMGFTHPLVQEQSPDPKIFCTLRLASISDENTPLKIIDGILNVKNIELLGTNEDKIGTQILPTHEITLRPWEINTVRLAFDNIHTASYRRNISTPDEDSSLPAGLSTVNTIPIKLGLKLSPMLTRPKVELTISNLSPYEEISGVVYLEVSKGDSIGPDQLSYTLPPLFSVQHFLEYQSLKPNSDTYIRAWTEYKGSETFAYLMPDKPFYKVGLYRNSNIVSVKVENLIPITISGYVSCLVLPERWVSSNICRNVSPEEIRFDILPNSEQILTFTLLEETAGQNILVCINAYDRQEIFTLE